LNERPADAVRYYEEAIQEVHAARDLRTEISVRLQLARYLVIEATKKIPDAAGRAASHLELAQTAANAIEFSDAQWRVRFLQGVVAENAGRTDEALAAYRDAVDRLDRLRAGLPQQEQRQAFMDNESIQELYQRNIALLTSAGRQAEAWEYLERGKARAFLEGLQGRRFRSTVAGSGASGDLEKLETQIVNLRAQLTPGNESVLRGAGREPALAHAELQQLEARFSAARQEAAISASRATQPLSLKPISLAEVRKALPPHAAVVEYAVLEGKLTAFVVTATGANQIQWEAKTKTLGNRIRQLRDLMSNPGSGEQLPPLLQDVSEELVAPVVKALPAGTDRLLIVPSQALNYIPFQALLLPDGRAMVEQYTISYLPSASTLQFLKPAEKASSDDLFMAALGNVSTEGWAPLPGTLAETAAIAKLYPKAPRITEGEFTHDAAVRALQEHEQVHFATHGLFDESAPLFSALLLGSSEGGRSRLSLYEIMDLKLRARLVVLSACETNRGKLMGGDEVAGLTRTFLTAGAETVVSSLWKVSDESTALLMQGLYRRLRAGVAPSTALRESELEVRKQFPHPFFWAPFVETGVM
jgi:CHAT domain-containing protein